VFNLTKYNVMMVIKMMMMDAAVLVKSKNTLLAIILSTDQAFV
jgi:hypothetical protein